MRRTPRIAIAALAGLALVLALAPGCASRKKVSTAQTTPPPPPVEQRAEEPPPPPPTSEKQEPSEPQISLQDAFFDFDDFSLGDEAKASLDNDAKYLEKNSSVRINIEGHCDERGSVEYNLSLGEKRAKSAKDYLVSYGIAANRITTISYGKERPFAQGHDESAWSQNRRAHFVVK